MTVSILGCLGLQLLNDGVCSFVLELDAVAEINKLRSDTLVGATLGYWWGILVHNGLLLLLLLGNAALVRGDGLAGCGFQNELENLKRIGILGGSGCDAEGVTSRQDDLFNISTLFT